MRPYVALTLLVPLLANAESLTPAQRATEARACRRRAEEVLVTYDHLITACEPHASFCREDLKAAKPAFDAQVALWKKLADAYDAGDLTAAQSLKDQTAAAGAVTTRWHERLDVRLKEADAAPSELHYNNLRPDAGSEAYPPLAAFIEARRAAADAWCTLAEQTTPDADAQKLADLREQAQRATDAAEVAHKAFDDALRRAKLLPKKEDPPAAVLPLLEQLRQLDEQRDAQRREDLERDAKARALDRQRDALEKQIRQLKEAAKQGAK